MPVKRRILATFEDGAAGGDRKRMKKIAISIDSSATNDDLAREIATVVKQGHNFTLEVAGGFELRGQDGIDMIRDDELVTVVTQSNLAPLTENSLMVSQPALPAHPPQQSDIARSGDPGRVQVRLVTAQLAQHHAKKNPKEHDEPDNGAFAFDGELISGNTLLTDLRQEAGRVFAWTTEDEMIIDGKDNACHHELEGSCCCPIAQEIEQKGLFSSLHCRLTIDGTFCGNTTCPYSHVELKESEPGVIAPQCSICDEALRFPCPACVPHATELASVVHCPLIQNAGCGHLHHAHCIKLHKDLVLIGCPSGCPSGKFPREPAVLDFPQPHLIVVWDGDKIDKVPVQFLEDLPKHGLFQLSTDTVVSLVEDFLSSVDFALPGLSLRIHSRDPTTETVVFTQSTLVSVCSFKTHSNQSYGRFNLFPTKTLPSLPNNTQTAEFSVDFHTSQSPIVACGCTPLKKLFPSIFTRDSDATCLVLYVVKRTNASEEEMFSTRRATASKEQAYIVHAAWQPSIPQSPRGMAALLSSLYLLAHCIPQKGPTGEQKVLGMMYAITHFPPAVRALGILSRNQIPQPEERAALSEALYHAVKDFIPSGARGPNQITCDPTRLFEGVRILLAHILKGVDASFSGDAMLPKPLEEISLICSVSHKRLVDPVILDTSVVNRGLLSLQQPGGELYHSTLFGNQTAPIATEIPQEQLLQLQQILAHSPLSFKSTLALHVNDICLPQRSCLLSLDSLGRDFIAAIRRANESELVTRGPLELKLASVIPPQIVVDQDGLLAVFTGRGCGTTRDVNFFRPINGGDTAVDVNDVVHALERVIALRKIEDTWQVDSFEGVSAALMRPPDEAIVLCLDLSGSMGMRSGVRHPSIDVPEKDQFDHEVTASAVVRDIVKAISDDIILDKAKAYLNKQHPNCYDAWKSSLDNNSSFTAYGDTDSESVSDYTDDIWDILGDLCTMARRDVLRLSYIIEDQDCSNLTTMKELMTELAYFVAASENQRLEVESHFLDIVINWKASELVGVEPYGVPRNLLDPKSGDILINPVHPHNAPDDEMFVNADSAVWFESQAVWPSGLFLKCATTSSDVKSAVDEWVSGIDLLNTTRDQGNGKAKEGIDTIEITLEHGGENTTWHLSTATSTRTLYSLANRATRGKYSTFTLRLSGSKAPINDSVNLTLGLTDLSHGGTLEISRVSPHQRQLFEVIIEFDDFTPAQKILLPKDASMLSVLSYIRAANCGCMSDFTIWHGLTNTGDGVRSGTVVKNGASLHDFRPVRNIYTFQCEPWHWRPSRVQRERKASRHLTRLHLLKELFNVFLNRAASASFDTSVSLVLGLVTFSDCPKSDQELTPIFESFRQQLDRVSAIGNTAVYDSLDTARAMLVQYRPDLPSLRRRIIIVTDGADTSSKNSAWEVCSALQKNQVVVDSVQVGDRTDNTLHAISVATGGYRFSPRTSLSDALSIFDLETMLSSAERISRPAKPLVLSNLKLLEYGNLCDFPIDIVTVDRFPQRVEHAKLQESVKSIATSITTVHIRDDRTKRIMRELKALATDPHPQIDLYVNDSDVSFSKIIVEGPKDEAKCPYTGGTFLLTCDLPEGYPRDPPEIRFVTFILHPNVSKQGKVCVAELGRLWSSDITLKEIFNLIYGLLLEPDLENPLEIQASLKYYDDDGTYALAVANAVTEHASKTREEWKIELEIGS